MDHDAPQRRSAQTPRHLVGQVEAVFDLPRAKREGEKAITNNLDRHYEPKEYAEMHQSMYASFALAVVAVVIGGWTTGESKQDSNIADLLRVQIENVDTQRNNSLLIRFRLSNLTEQNARISKIAFDSAVVGSLRFWRVNSADVFELNSEYPGGVLLPKPLPEISIRPHGDAHVEVVIPLARDRFRMRQVSDVRPKLVSRLPSGTYAIDASPFLKLELADGKCKEGITTTWNKLWHKE